MKNIFSRTIALVLALSIILTTGIMQVQAVSISDGNSKTVRVTMGMQNFFLTTTNGNRLSGEYWTYNTNDGISGPGYCIDWLRP